MLERSALTVITVITVFAAWLAVAGDAAAQAECSDRDATVATSDMARSKLVALDNNFCLGGVKCTSDVCRRAHEQMKAIDKAVADGTKATQPISVLLKMLSEEAGALSTRTTVSAQTRDAATTALTRMAIALATLVDTKKTAAAAWMIEQDLTVFRDEEYEVSIPKLLAPCNSEKTCTARYVEAQALLDLVNLFRRVLNEDNEPKRHVYGRYIERLDKQWKAYLSSSRGQYPWELLINSARYRKTAAFDAPPTSQLVLLHPGAGYEIGRNANNKNPSEALLLETVGYYRWKWTDDDRMQQRLGGSFAFSWRDAGADRRRMGYAALVYLPRASTVGYVWRPQDGKDEHAVMLSADLVKFIRGTAGLRERLVGGR